MAERCRAASEGEHGRARSMLESAADACNTAAARHGVLALQPDERHCRLVAELACARADDQDGPTDCESRPVSVGVSMG